MSEVNIPTISESILKIVSPFTAVVLFFPCFYGGIYFILRGIAKFID